MGWSVEDCAGETEGIGDGLTATAILVAADGESDYTLAAVSALARKSGLSDDDIEAAQRARARDPRTSAALRFSEHLLEKRGRVPGSELDTLTEAGFTDGEVAEIIAAVVLNIYRNYFNLVAEPEIDFPFPNSSAAIG
jgi:alkylhydroperoxidase family enzyme